MVSGMGGEEPAAQLAELRFVRLHIDGQQPFQSLGSGLSELELQGHQQRRATLLQDWKGDDLRVAGGRSRLTGRPSSLPFLQCLDREVVAETAPEGMDLLQRLPAESLLIDGELVYVAVAISGVGETL